MGDGGHDNGLIILTAWRQGKGFAVQEKGDMCLPQGDVNNIEWVCLSQMKSAITIAIP